MAPPRKHGRRSTARRHLVDVSTITPPASEDEPRSSAPASVATEERPPEGADGHTYSGRGRVRFELAPEEYKEYRRLQDAKSAAGAVPDTTERHDSDGSQALEAFVGQLDSRAEHTPRPGEDQATCAVDPFFDALRAEPARRVSANAGRDAHGSAALDGIVASPRPRSPRARGRSAAIATTALLALCVAAYLILLPHSSAHSHAVGSAEVARSSSVGDFRSFASSLSAVDRAAGDVARVAGDQERAALKKANAQRVARRQAQERRIRQRRRARAAAARAHQQAVTSLSTTTTTSQAPAVAASSTTSSPTARSTGTSSSTTSTAGSTATHSHPFGDGGVLGAGHAG
jgi:hypothetical protein